MKKMYKIMLAILMVSAMAFGTAYACECVSMSHSNGLFYGHGDPTSTDGACVNDLYLNLDSNTLWQLQQVTTTESCGCNVTSYQWVQIDTLQGANGKDGTNGTNGTNGTDGNKFYFGAYDPQNLPANEGDIFLQTSTYNIYEYASGWTLIGNIKGATGANGTDGINGLNGTNGTNDTDPQTGANFIIDFIPPTASVGNNGDLFLDLTTKDIYMKETGLWYNLGPIS